ncbi:Beta-lactamase [Streptomyces sp. di188]|nr:Beta-lactamase [Streptomyces sp. di188]SCD51387.1 Beta-lactamase [Streptomyces sp. di50b]
MALHRPLGMAVRYQAYDEETDTGVELPTDQQIPMAEDTVFDLASVSKLFTSILAVQQIERGRVGLEAPVASYLPDFGRAGKQDVTIRQLLTHTSGFRAWIPLYEAPTYQEKVRRVYDEELASPPGTAYLYSGLNLISLQLVLEHVTGRRLDVLLREEITEPLGMRRTRYNPPASWKPKIAATEDARKPWSGLDRGLVWGEVHDENAYSLGGVAGHAGVFSDAWDLAVLARTLLDGGGCGRRRIPRPESVELMCRGGRCPWSARGPPAPTGTRGGRPPGGRATRRAPARPPPCRRIRRGPAAGTGRRSAVCRPPCPAPPPSWSVRPPPVSSSMATTRPSSYGAGGGGDGVGRWVS